MGHSEGLEEEGPGNRGPRGSRGSRRKCHLLLTGAMGCPRVPAGIKALFPTALLRAATRAHTVRSAGLCFWELRENASAITGWDILPEGTFLAFPLLMRATTRSKRAHVGMAHAFIETNE